VGETLQFSMSLTASTVIEQLAFFNLEG